MAGRWEGTAFENFGHHGGTASAKLRLDLNPDGTWTERGRAFSDLGRWTMQRDSVVLRSNEGTHRRLTLKRHENGIYGVVDQSMMSGSRITPMTIEWHRVESS